MIEIRVANYHASLSISRNRNARLETQIGVEETLLIFLILHSFALGMCCFSKLFSDTKDKMF